MYGPDRIYWDLLCEVLIGVPLSIFTSDVVLIDELIDRFFDIYHLRGEAMGQLRDRFVDECLMLHRLKGEVSNQNMLCWNLHETRRGLTFLDFMIRTMIA